MMGRIIVGIDEAGRGSVVGELVVAALAVRESEMEKLLDLGVRDSKALTPNRRREIYLRLGQSGFFFSVVPIRPRDVDSDNINNLVTGAVESLLLRVIRFYGTLPSLVIVDKYGDYRGLKSIAKRLGLPPSSMVVEERADARYPAVSAASIVAKVVRDARMEVLRRMYGVRGSGYPSDPETREWLRDVFSRGEKPSYIRYTWSTVKKLGGPWKGKKSKNRTLDEFLGV